jgi:lantibiotic modifying enzyme
MSQHYQTNREYQTNRQWRATLPPVLRNRVLDTIQYIAASRLCEPEMVISVVESEKHSRYICWEAATLACGYTSMALLYLYLARSLHERLWQKITYTYLRLTAEASHHEPLLRLGMFSGISGLAAVISLFCQDESNYWQTQHDLATRVAYKVIKHQWYKEKTATMYYDIIDGAAGILGYLISTHLADALIEEAIQKLLSYLVWLAENNGEQERSRLLVSLQPFSQRKRDNLYPQEHFNCGLAHGIPGLLAALSLAWQTGYRVDGQWEAIKTLGQWVAEHHVYDKLGISWPAMIPLSLSDSPQKWKSLPPARTAWCYGTPGVTRALWLAGTVLSDDKLRSIATNGFNTIFEKSGDERNISSPTICHGLSGLLMICLRFAHETGDSTIHQQIPFLVNQILDCYNSDFPFGFRNEMKSGTYVDDPGFLTGASGVILALLAAATDTEPKWDRFLMIA